MDLFTSIVPVSDHHLVQLACDMVGGSDICITIGVHAIRTMGRRVRALLFWGDEVLIKVVPAVRRHVTILLAELALHPGLVGVEVAATMAIGAVATAATTTARVPIATTTVAATVTPKVFKYLA
jgi:hypothetical protein